MSGSVCRWPTRFVATPGLDLPTGLSESPSWRRRSRIHRTREGRARRPLQALSSALGLGLRRCGGRFTTRRFS